MFPYQGKRVKCSPAQAKHKLFIGNVPRSWGEEDMRTAVTNVGPGVITIELVKVGPVFFFDICLVSLFSHLFVQFFIVIGVHMLLHDSYSSNYILFMERRLTPPFPLSICKKKTILLL